MRKSSQKSHKSGKSPLRKSNNDEDGLRLSSNAKPKSVAVTKKFVKKVSVDREPVRPNVTTATAMEKIQADNKQVKKWNSRKKTPRKKTPLKTPTKNPNLILAYNESPPKAQ